MFFFHKVELAFWHKHQLLYAVYMLFIRRNGVV
jgi:hypothetical protein